MSDERLEVHRHIDAEPAAVFAVLADPPGHVAIDASGMLQDATGEPVTAVGDTFLVHMDRESLGDRPELGKYDIEVTITAFEQDREIAWTVGRPEGRPAGHFYGYRLEVAEGGTDVTSYYDWSQAREDWRKAGVFPVISERTLAMTLGILDRTVRRGYPRGPLDGRE